MSRSLIYILLATSLLLGACTVRQMTDAQRTQENDQQECAADATSLNDPPHNSDNPLWSAYFERCMRARGYSKAQLHQMWY